MTTCTTPKQTINTSSATCQYTGLLRHIYTTDYPDIGMGQSRRLSNIKKPILLSSGFGSCFGLLITHQCPQRKLDATLFHVSNQLSDPQIKDLQHIKQQAGHKYATFIATTENHKNGHLIPAKWLPAGKIGWIEKAQKQLHTIIGLPLTVNEPILWPHADMTLAYDLAQNQLDIASHTNHKTKTFTPFSVEQLKKTLKPFVQEEESFVNLLKKTTKAASRIHI